MVRESIRVQGDLSVFVEDVVRRLSVNATANLVQETPVDTGWARANWVPELGKAFEGTAGTRAQAESGNIVPGPQQTGIGKVLANYRLRMGPVFVSNNVPYITRLNDGTSSQAPRAFVQMAIARTIRETLGIRPRPSRPGPPRDPTTGRFLPRGS